MQQDQHGRVHRVCPPCGRDNSDQQTLTACSLGAPPVPWVRRLFLARMRPPPVELPLYSSLTSYSASMTSSSPGAPVAWAPGVPAAPAPAPAPGPPLSTSAAVAS